MNNRWGILATFWAILFFLLIGGSQQSFADKVILDNGVQYDAVAVIGYATHPDGGVFTIRSKADESSDFLDHPIEMERVHQIRFDNPNNTSDQRTFRIANIRLNSGEVVQNISFSSFFIREGVPVLNLEPGETLPNGSSSLPIQNVDELLFSHPTNMPAMLQSTAPVTLVEETDPDAEITEFNSDQSLATQMFGEEDYVFDNIDGDWESDLEKYRIDNGSDRLITGAGSRGSILGMELFGMAVGLIALGIYLFIATISGGIYLYFSSRIEGVSDFPLWKSFIAAAALAFFPWLFFFICLRFIPIFGLWAGLASLYGTARAIVMGAMEVMEEKAESVLWTFLLLQTLVIVLCIRYL